MVAKTLLTRSMEAIAHQGDDGFFRALTEAIHYIRENKDRIVEQQRELIQESEIESTIMAYTGLFTKITISPEYGLNAFSMPELVDPNHVLGNEGVGNSAERRIEKNLQKIKDDYIGVVDLENGRVSGAFSKLVTPVGIGTDLLLSNKDGEYFFNDNEIAAIILHELGHAFTFFEYVGHQVVLTHTLGETTRLFNNSTTPKRKVEVAKVVKNILEIDDLDEEAFGEIDDGATYLSLVVSLYDQNRRISTTQTSFYDTTIVEAVAEQFTVRYGAGRANVTGLDKLNRYIGRTSSTRAKRFANELTAYVGILILMIVGTVATFGLALPLMLALVPMIISENLAPSMYDSPYDTMKRIRDDMVKELKDSKLSKGRRQRIQEDIKAVDEILERTYEHRQYISAFFGKILPNVRKGMRQKKVIQHLETLDANNLYKHSNDFQLVEGD